LADGLEFISFPLLFKYKFKKNRNFGSYE